MNELVTNEQTIKNKIYTIRGLQVMVDSDLAQLYGVAVKVLNQAVKRNIERFPEKFRFQLTDEEYSNLKSQIVTSSDVIPLSSTSTQNLKSQNAISKHGGRRYIPYVFTEQGVSMLSAVLRSKTAIKVSIQIMDAFVEMRKFISYNAGVFQRLDKIEQKQLITDTKLDKVFEALEAKDFTPKQGIFYNGQIFDAYKLIADIIRSAKSSIVLIDNYVDDSVLTFFTKCKKKIEVSIYTKKISKVFKQDLDKYNAQYHPIKINKLNTAHDRFLIIDKKTVYHFGASLKDAGKKWFAFSKLDIDARDILNKLK